MSKSNDNSGATNGGIGIFGALGLLFIGLKLGGIINWSWFWVTLPLWGGLGLILSVLAIFGVLYAGAAILDAIGDWRDMRRRLKGNE